MATKASERMIAARDWLYEYFAVQTDSSLRNGENSAMVKMLAAYEAATIERCAQIAEREKNGGYSPDCGFFEDGWDAGIDKAAAAIRSMGEK